KLFYIKYVDKNKLELKEGEKIVEMTLQEALKDKKVTNFTKEIINFILQKAKSSKATEWLASHSVADKWILNKMDILIKQVSEDLDNYRFSQAGERLREFTWNDFADWYIEVSKFEQNSEKDKILMMILRDLLKLWHPFMPFVTETIWSEMRKDEFLMVERWPRRRDTLQCVSTRDAENFELIQSIIIAIRNARSQYRIKPSQKIKAVIYAGNKVKLIKSQAELIKKLRTGVERLEVKQKGGKIKEAIYLTVNGPSYSAGTSIEIYLIISGFDFQAEVDRIEKAIKEQRARIKILEKKLSNKQFIKKAPRKIVNQEKEKLAIWQNKLSKFNEQLNHLK
ncbi:MAG: class I tRNA ligase family protein, partial [Patescibacteria group bacterium]|nr:class I tRNA ligase family protein [Patescibacteria group bacterium]